MLWELDSLGAPTVVCDKETHGKVLGVVGVPNFLLLPWESTYLDNKKYCSRIGLTACFGGCFTGVFY